MFFVSGAQFSAVVLNGRISSQIDSHHQSPSDSTLGQAVNPIFRNLKISNYAETTKKTRTKYDYSQNQIFFKVDVFRKIELNGCPSVDFSTDRPTGNDPKDRENEKNKTNRCYYSQAHFPNIMNFTMSFEPRKTYFLPDYYRKRNWIQ